MSVATASSPTCRGEDPGRCPPSPSPPSRNSVEPLRPRFDSNRKNKLLESIDSIKREFANEELSSIKDKRLISILQNNSSKIVAENGHPLVMFHGDDERKERLQSEINELERKL